MRVLLLVLSFVVGVAGVGALASVEKSSTGSLVTAVQVATAQGEALKEAGELKTVTICRPPTGKGARTLKVYRRDDQGCRATYTKLGQEQSVGENRAVEQCESVLAGIRKNLEAANWSCRGPKDVATIQSSESQVQ
jgi:hypothetical protein